MLCFNSRSYVGSNMFMWLICISSYKFQFTLPRRERFRGKINRRYLLSFNSRSHTGSDHHKDQRNESNDCFNSRSHAGNDVPTGVGESPICVSIHALTQGAIPFASIALLSIYVSTHAPTQGAMRYPEYNAWLSPISTHAPT